MDAVGSWGSGAAGDASSEAREPRSDAGDPSIAKKLNRLFKTMHPRDRGEYTYEEVAEAIRQRGGTTISATYLWQLRKGIRDNPTLKHLEAIAGFFGVPPNYFFDADATRRIDQELELLATLRDSDIRVMALRAVGLSTESLKAITNMIEHVRQLEGLPDEPYPQERAGKQSPGAAEDRPASEPEEPSR